MIACKVLFYGVPVRVPEAFSAVCTHESEIWNVLRDSGVAITSLAAALGLLRTKHEGPPQASHTSSEKRSTNDARMVRPARLEPVDAYFFLA